MSANKSIKKNEFRKYKKTMHPAYIYKKVGNMFHFIGITHSKITGNVNNIPLTKNPNPLDYDKAYLLSKSDVDNQNNFGRKYNNWKFSKNDKKKVNKIKNK